jgi:hypothetical protein
MIALLSPKFWIALAVAAALTFSHGFAYKSGRAAVRADWDKEKAKQVTAALQASEERRMKEKALNFTNEGIINAYTKEKARLVAAERVTADKLRSLQAAAGSDSRPDSAPLGGADDPRPAIISQCGTALAILDNDFKNLASQTKGLQDYASGVCIAK